MSKTLNAKITHATIQGICDYLTVNIHFNACVHGYNSHDCWSVKIDENSCYDGHNIIKNLMKVLEITSWEEIKGMYVRIEVDDQKGGQVYKIGHITKDQWFTI